MKKMNFKKIHVPEGNFCGNCPYLDSTKHCKLTGTYQDGYHLQTYCLSSGEWLKCANYESYAK
jgi:hypothetical protein